MLAAHERVNNIGIWLIVLAYAAAAVFVLMKTVQSCEELRTFSTDSAGICEQTGNLIAARSLTVYDPKRHRDLDGCNPYPYGQLYDVAIILPLIVVQALTPVAEATVIRWSIVLLVISGIATLLLTYRIGSRLYGSTYGLLATLLLLGTPEFVRWSFEIHPDLPQLALLAAGFYFAVRLYERGVDSGRRWVLELGLASFFAGAAMATKFNGVLLLPVIALACNAPFLSGSRRSEWRDVLRRNVGAGSVCIAAFAAGWVLFSPCFVFNPSLFLEPFLRAAKITSGDLTRPESATQRIFDFLHSNRTLGNHIVGWAGYIIILASLLVGFGRLLLRHSSELKRPRFLADVFVSTVVFYSLGLGQGLYDGVLLSGYGRYVLPGVPIAYIAGMRIVHTLANRRQGHRWALPVLVVFILLGQSALINAAVRQYQEFYLAKEAGFFRVNEWILENIPPGDRIYADRYIHVPAEGYNLTQSFLISRVDIVQSSDYLITKTLAYDVFTDPDRWLRYSGSLHVPAAKRLHEILELGRPRGIIKVAEFSAGDAFDGSDAVIVYKNLNAAK